MPKTIRPQRLFAANEENAVIVEYIVQIYDDSNNETLSQKKQTKIHTHTIDSDANISKLAKKIVNQCKHIPQQWTCQVEEALITIQQRCDNHSEEDIFEEPFVILGEKVDQVLELLYGDINAKIVASSLIISICHKQSNIEFVAQHHQLLSALTRIFNDQTVYSSELCFNICKIFHSLSNFERCHPRLLKYQVGSIIMTTLRQETDRCIENDQNYRENAEYDKENDRNHRHYCILYVCLSTLMRLSDEMEILCKMMKKGLTDIIEQTINLDLPKLPTKSALFLLHRASAFGETATQCYYSNNSLINSLIQFLQSTDEVILSSSLAILYNLSFNKTCRMKMIQSGLCSALAELLDRSMATMLLYRISVDQQQRRNILNPELERALVRVLNLCKTAVPTGISALLVNLSCDSLWAERISQFNFITDDRIASGDMFIAKVMRNLSKWTCEVQHRIILAKNVQEIKSIDNHRDKYSNVTNRDEEIQSTDKENSLWRKGKTIASIISTCVNNENSSIELDTLATLNHLTSFDLPSSQQWRNIISDYPILTLLRNITLRDESYIDIKLEAIIFCTQLCKCRICAKMIAESQVLNELIQIWEECDEDAEVHLHILIMCEKLLGIHETRNFILMGTDIMQYIFDSLEHKNVVIRKTSIRCLDRLADYACYGDRDDLLKGKFSSIGKNRRFVMYNSKWPEYGSA